FHCGPDAMAHVPRGLVRATADLPMDLQGTDPLLTLHHQVNDLKPSSQRIVGVLKHRMRNDREAIPIGPTTALLLADPMKRTGLERVDFLTVAARALDAFRPPTIPKKRFTRFFRRK